MDIKEILYSEIDRLGKDNIKISLNQDMANSKVIIDTILKTCLPKLQGEKFDSDEYVLFGEALLHFLLTMAVIPSQRKITVDSNEISVIIPNLQTLRSEPNKAIIIQFLNYQVLDLENVIINLTKIQPHQENIWLIVSEYKDKKISKFIISADDFKPDMYNNNFNEILVRIDRFLKDTNYNGFKILG